ncbi:predicted protein, partial [Postia placenta Mad-698-R]
MSASPQRNRRPLMLASTQGPMQGISPRESTPSPSFRDRQRATKSHSLPIVPSANQILNQNQQVVYPHAQQPSPTISNSSHQSRRSPPPTSRISPATSKMSAPALAREHSPERKSPPPLGHAHSQPVVPHMIPLPPPGPQHTQSQPNIPQVAQNPHQPRPINRVPHPMFLTEYPGSEDAWRASKSKELAEYEEMQQGQFSHPAGTAGVAYAGGAASSNIGSHLRETVQTTAKDPAVER